jgi:serine/threonine-protein kinase ATR
MASSAVTHAMLLDDGNALVEKAKFYRAKNDLHRALILLDAGMPNMEDGGGGAGRLSSNASAHRSSTSSTSSSEAALVANARKKLVAQRIMLAADWTFESGLSAGDDVISRYQRATRLCPKWEDGYFSLGRYYDRLLQGQEDRLDKEGRDIFSPKSIPDGASSKQIKEVIVSAERDSHTAALIFDHAVQVVDNYGRAMRYGHRNVHVTLPRLLTVWFDYTSKLNDMVENEKHHHQDKRTKRSQRHCDPASYLSRLNGLLKTLAEDIPAYQWYMALPQLVSHMGLQSNVKCSQILNGIVSKVLAKYPRHVAWTVMGVANMESTVVGKKRAAAFVETMRYVIETQAVPAGIVLQTGSRLFYDLIKLAKLKTGRDHYVHHPIGNRRELDKARLLVPKQSFLIARLPGPDEPAIRDEDWEAFDGEGSGLVTIVKFEDDVQVISSAVCPKKLVCCGSNGRKYNLLCKFEKKGDFRKDSRMMKLFTLVNRFLQSDPEGRRRNLRMRTYNVTCLDEKSGLLEWVDNTMPVQYVIDGIYKKHPGTPPAKLTNRLYEQIQQLARSYPSDPIATIQSYRHQIVSHFPTLLHEWFDRTFSVPAEWFEARLSFSRSVAVWSMVGHIVGLGDRHSQNILMDLGTGECVHVDFDCIFDKGLMLRTPERAPFRLTRNIVDGMGVTGYEGVFRHCCECTMGILRSQQNQDMLINNLEAFVQDPLVTWFKTGVVGATSSSRSNNNNHNSRGQQHQSTQDNRIDPLLNATHSATHVLSTIRQRLSGVYNYSIENVLARNPEKRAYLQKKIASTMREAGVREAQAVIDNIPLSVQGQVQRLIKEATSEDNLIQMYPGWMPFL